MRTVKFRRLAMTGIIALLFYVFYIGDLFASDVDPDVLYQTLVDNGLLTNAEARRIISRSQQKKSIEDSMESSKESPYWKKNINLTGDVSVRYDQQKTKSVTTPLTRFRGRLRYRLGVETRINEKVKVAAGLTSGDGDPRSSYQTFSNSSEKSEIHLDYAYGQWSPASWASLIMGQYQRDEYLWAPTDMMWDSDFRLQGGAVHVGAPFMGNYQAFINGGVTVLDELLTNDHDPTMFFIQPGVGFENSRFDFKLTANRYVFNSVKNLRLDHSSCSNKGLTPIGDNCTGTLPLEYDAGGASVEAGYKFYALGRAKRIALFGDYIKNLTTPDDNVGWAGGARLGDQKIATFGDWQAAYQYTYLERDAVLDILPNSDRYEGQTNVTGIKTGFDFGLWKDIKLGVNYYRDNRIIGTKVPKSSIIADVIYKF